MTTPPNRFLICADRVVSLSRKQQPHVGNEHSADQELGVIKHGAVLIDNGKIAKIVLQDELGSLSRDIPIIAKGTLLTPGLIDAHTHAAWVGSRHNEYVVRLAGGDYEAIARAGGGIVSSMHAIHEATFEDIVHSLRDRLRRMASLGVTTVEVKSGYGLTFEGELRQLEAIEEVQRDPFVPRIIPTYLALHAIPPDRKNDRVAYIAEVRDSWLPQFAARKLMHFVDAYVDRNAFTIDEARTVLMHAKELGLGVRLHAGQFADVGGAELAAQLGAASADHLENVSEAGLHAMHEAGVFAVLLPVASWTLQQPPPPIQTMRNTGTVMVVASDSNPGTAPTESLPLSMAFAARSYGLTPAEILFGVTGNAALSLNAPNIGHLTPGAEADLVLWEIPHEHALLQPWGISRAELVLRSGNILYSKSKIHITSELLFSSAGRLVLSYDRLMNIRRTLCALPLLASLGWVNLSSAHPVTVDGNAAEWVARVPNAANVGLIARTSQGTGEYIWSDALGDTRTDIASPEQVADISAFQVTGTPNGLAFLLRRTPGGVFSSPPVQVQIAIDTDRMAGSGQEFFAEFADTKVANDARWERLIETLFGSGGAARVIDSSFNQVGAAQAVSGANGDIEVFASWTTLGLNGPPTTPLRFTVATFRAQNNDITVDIGGAMFSNALDAITNYGDPASAMYPNTYADVQDLIVNYSFDIYFDTNGEVYSPVVIQRFVPNSSGGSADEWYSIRNVSPATISLTGYKLGDEETPDGNEGMFSFPTGTTLAAGATYTVARSGSAYQAFFGAAPDAELPPGASMAVPDMVAYTPWTAGAAGTLALNNPGDELLLLDASNTILDIATYGTGTYPGVTAFTPAPGTDEVLSRNPLSADTDNCQVDFSNAGKECVADAQCGGSCKQCIGGVCGNKPQGSSCADSLICNGAETCDGAGNCNAGTPLNCDDNNQCTVDTCSPMSGCVNTPIANGSPCDDGNACNTGDHCEAGSCIPTSGLDCDDGNPCTADGCDGIGNCTHSNVIDGTTCSDNNACTASDICTAGVCAGSMIDCNDTNDCTVDSCDPMAGCTYTNAADGSDCSDSDQCTTMDTCQAGTCTAGPVVDCVANECAETSICNSTTGLCDVTNLPDGTPCSIGTCEAGTCTPSGMGGSGGSSGTGGSAGTSGTAGSGGMGAVGGTGGNAGTAGAGGSGAMAGSAGNGGSGGMGATGGTGATAGNGGVGTGGSGATGTGGNTAGEAGTSGSANAGEAGTAGESGANSGATAGTTNAPTNLTKDPATDDSGCGCEVPGRHNQSSQLGLIALAILGGLARRRRNN